MFNQWQDESSSDDEEAQPRGAAPSKLIPSSLDVRLTTDQLLLPRARTKVSLLPLSLAENFCMNGHPMVLSAAFWGTIQLTRPLVTLPQQMFDDGHFLSAWWV
jgi:hypothetical protein